MNCIMMMMVYIDLGDEKFISNIPITVLYLYWNTGIFILKVKCTLIKNFDITLNR